MKFFIILSCIAVFAFGASVPNHGERIVGGDETTIDQVPYQASLRYHQGHQCGATILDQDTCLTAAHCVYGLSLSKLSLRIGGTKHWEGEEHKIASIAIHPNYRPGNNQEHDVAVLKTETTIQYAPNIQPIGMEMPGLEVPAGTTCTICGWGTENENSQIIVENIRCVDVELITLEMCRSHYGFNNVTTNMLCAQTLGHGTCQGDSGGALVCNGLISGIASWAKGCARPAYPGVYTKMSSYFTWVDGQME